MSADSLKRTPLYDAHLAAGGKMVPFAGYDMPVQYEGILAEAKAVRASAGMFDVSHMARLRFTGAEASDFLDEVTSNNVGTLVDGKGQYALLPNESGGTVDDVILYRWSRNDYGMVVNASNHEKDVEWFKRFLPQSVNMTDNTDATALIAVQGPAATSILASLCSDSDLQDTPSFGVKRTQIAGVKCEAARSGYTGEDGFEITCAASEAVALWDALKNAGVTVCGLGARDTLRVEAGLPLYGHELSDELSPIAAGLGWAIGKEKTFVGSGPIKQARASGTPTKLFGIRLGTKRLISVGASIFVNDREVGQVSSGVISPMLDCGIALAFLDSSLALDTPCEIDLRGKREPAVIVNKRFFKRER